MSLEAFIKWGSFLPLGLARAVGSLLGILTWLFSGPYRRRFRENWLLARAHFKAPPKYPVKNPSMVRALAQAGCLAAELPAIWCNPQTVGRMTIEGWDLVQGLLARGQGLIVLTPHLGAFELGARAFARRQPITVLYRPSRSPTMERLLQRFRPAAQLTAVPANGQGVRALLRTLKSAGVIGILPDQVPSQGEGVWVNFFGRPAYTMSLPVRLAQATGAPLVWVLAVRRPGGWSLVFKPWQSLEPGPLDDLNRLAFDLQAMNHQLEDLIALAPEQYLWGYNRYRGRPPSQVS
ncbi:MAG: lysophospholipid acyltransferase family protein [Proteobacteria bacterium]|nr:lysophospholipid acyltransferase family protein [Pseudomonadota bacterium]